MCNNPKALGSRTSTTKTIPAHVLGWVVLFPKTKKAADLALLPPLKSTTKNAKRNAKKN